jgi:hypothetical protein
MGAGSKKLEARSRKQGAGSKEQGGMENVFFFSLLVSAVSGLRLLHFAIIFDATQKTKN